MAHSFRDIGKVQRTHDDRVDEIVGTCEQLHSKMDYCNQEIEELRRRIREEKTNFNTSLDECFRQLTDNHNERHANLQKQINELQQDVAGRLEQDGIKNLQKQLSWLEQSYEKLWQENRSRKDVELTNRVSLEEHENHIDGLSQAVQDVHYRISAANYKWKWVAVFNTCLLGAVLAFNIYLAWEGLK